MRKYFKRTSRRIKQIKIALIHSLNASGVEKCLNSDNSNTV